MIYSHINICWAMTIELTWYDGADEVAAFGLAEDPFGGIVNDVW
jgi:hypothetical protein